MDGIKFIVLIYRSMLKRYIGYSFTWSREKTISVVEWFKMRSAFERAKTEIAISNWTQGGAVYVFFSVAIITLI
jgi:hypothetical protein